jgi:hypothetical protein
MKEVIAGLLLLVAGCNTGRTAGVDPVADDPHAPVQIHVTNNHGYPVEIYAAGQGTSYRIGTVLPGQAGKFNLRPGMIGHGPIELIARGSPGAQPARSGGMMLNPGDIIDFDVSPQMLNSMANIRPRRI